MIPDLNNYSFKKFYVKVDGEWVEFGDDLLKYEIEEEKDMNKVLELYAKRKKE